MKRKDFTDYDKKLSDSNHIDFKQSNSIMLGFKVVVVLLTIIFLLTIIG